MIFPTDNNARRIEFFNLVRNSFRKLLIEFINSDSLPQWNQHPEIFEPNFLWLFVLDNQLSNEILMQLAAAKSKMKFNTDFTMATYDEEFLKKNL